MKDDKKKSIVLIALFVVILGVGAFQLTSGGSAPAPAPGPKKAPKAEAATASHEPGKGLVVEEGEKTGEEAPAVDPTLVAVAALSPRDPFDGRRYVPQTPVQQPAQSAPLKAPVRSTNNYRPPVMSGQNFGGSINGGGYNPLPVAGPGSNTQGGTAVAPGAKLPSADDFNYQVSGVITGSKNAAVFTDDKGNQRLITAGSSIDGDAQLVSVGRGKVTVRHRGKLKTFRVGGD